MGIMHKEVLKKRKAPVLILSIIMISIAIVISQVFRTVNISGFGVSSISDPIILLLIGVFLFSQYRECKSEYKYSIIGEDFIINRISDKKVNTLQDININDIIYIKKTKVGFLAAIFSKRYACSAFSFDVYCCRYRDGNKIRKFYFQPSYCLVDKINRKKVA
ncbi:hypothetical protein [Clostridium sp. YIM B02551]|uniref:hypothetical protein n=1 Tax=Clostridium sp. YIM B02551 TaxID=2910679 RepID=UPI001EEC57F9|nr:hypothetical protein [Clostridium sp. YIM B02551]